MPPAKAELNAGRPFIAFDYWNNAIRPFSGSSIAITLPPRSCAVLSVREITGHPQVLSTSRHITQGMTDVLSEHWDGRSCTLSGESEIIGGEPYEMRLLSQTERGAAILISADAEGNASALNGQTSLSFLVSKSHPLARKKLSGLFFTGFLDGSGSVLQGKRYLLLPIGIYPWTFQRFRDSVLKSMGGVCILFFSILELRDDDTEDFAVDGRAI